MKKLIIMLLLLTSLSMASTIPDSLLTPEQKALVESKTTQENVKGWVGIGKEIGSAVDASLKAVTDRSNEFANTPVGKITIVMVVYKVMEELITDIIWFSIASFIFMILITISLFKLRAESDTDYKNLYLGVFITSGCLWFLTGLMTFVNVH